MTRVRIVSLGEVVTQNQMKTLNALATAINSENPRSAMGALGKILQHIDTQHSLDMFKQGMKSEEDFTLEMIAKIKEETGVELSVDDFDKAWDAMNPDFADFSPVLLDILNQNLDSQKIVFVSYTNVKDMKHLIKELDAHGMAYTRDKINGELNSIGGVSLYLSYSEKKSKAEIILQIVKTMMNASLITESALNEFTFFGKGDSSNDQPLDIKYVCSTPGITDPVLLSLDEKNRVEVKEAIDSEEIEVLHWNKKEKQVFSEAIKTTTVYSVSALRV